VPARDCETIIDKKADYVLALKGNQGSLREDVEVFAAEQKARNFANTTISQDTTINGDHGRIETRTTTVIQDIGWLRERHGWPGLNGVVMVESSREVGGKIEQETRFYITSLVMLAHLLGPVVRSHWSVENSLHWIMDMIFRDDECRVRTEHAPANFAAIKHMAHNLLRNAPAKAHCAAGARLPAGMMSSWPVLSLGNFFTRLPCHLALPYFPTGDNGAYRGYGRLDGEPLVMRPTPPAWRGPAGGRVWCGGELHPVHFCDVNLHAHLAFNCRRR
jgi:predicted transposase YbfD/YdcC